MESLGRIVSAVGLSIAIVGYLAGESHGQAPAPIEASDASRAAWEYQFTPSDEAFLDQVQRGCFNYFWHEVGHPALLARDKTAGEISSTAAVGFQLSSLPIGVERGWISRAEGEQRALEVLRALVDRTDNRKFGIYLHYLDCNSGGLPDLTRAEHAYEIQASTIDHALFQAGVMTAGSYFGGKVEGLANGVVAGADWRAMYDEKKKLLTMGWRASTERGVDGPGEIRPHYWSWCSDEERLIYFLAAGSANDKHAVEPAAYYRLDRIVKQHEQLPPYVVSYNGSLFTYFFAHCWIDYRHLAADDPAHFDGKGPRVDWFENSRRAVLTQRQRCIEVASLFPTLSANRWGLAPCLFHKKYLVAEVRPNVSDKDLWLDGVVPPYAAGSAIMFAPRESLAALREYRSLKGPAGKPLAWRDPDQGGYGFVDSFSLAPPYGHDENLGVDVGPMLLAIENARTGLIWKLFMQHPDAQRAIQRLKLKPRESGE